MKNKTIIAMLLVLSIAVVMFTVMGCQEAAQLVIGNEGVVNVEVGATTSLGVSHTGELKSGQNINYSVILGAELITLEGGNVKGVNEGRALVGVALDDQNLYIQVNVKNTVLDEARASAISSLNSLGFTNDAAVNALDENHVKQMKAEYDNALLFYINSIQSSSDVSGIENVLAMAQDGLNNLTNKYLKQAEVIGLVNAKTIDIANFTLPTNDAVYTDIVNECITSFGLDAQKELYITKIMSAINATEAVNAYTSFNDAVNRCIGAGNQIIREYKDLADLQEELRQVITNGDTNNNSAIEALEDQIEKQEALLNSIRKNYDLIQQNLAGIDAFNGVDISFINKTVFFNDNKFNASPISYNIEPKFIKPADVSYDYSVSVLVNGQWIKVCENDIWDWTVAGEFVNVGVYSYRLDFTLRGNDNEGNEVVSTGMEFATLTILKATFATPIWPELRYDKVGVYTQLDKVEFKANTGLAGEGTTEFGKFEWFEGERLVEPANFGYAVELIPNDIQNYTVIRQIVRVPTATIMFGLQAGSGEKDYDGEVIDESTISWTLLNGYYEAIDLNDPLNPVVKVPIVINDITKVKYAELLDMYKDSIDIVVDKTTNDGINNGDYVVSVNAGAVINQYFAVDASACQTGTYTIHKVTINQINLAGQKVYDATVQHKDITNYALSNVVDYYASFTKLVDISGVYETEVKENVAQYELYGKVQQGAVNIIQRDNVSITINGGTDFASKNVGTYVYNVNDNVATIVASVIDIDGNDRTANYVCDFQPNNSNTRVTLNSTITPRGVYATGTVYEREYNGTANVYAKGTQEQLDKGESQVLNILDDNNDFALDNTALGAMQLEKDALSVKLLYDATTNIYINAKYSGNGVDDNGKNAGLNKAVLFENTADRSFELIIGDTAKATDSQGNEIFNYVYVGDPANKSDENNSNKLFYTGDITKALAREHIVLSGLLAERVYNNTDEVYGSSLVTKGTSLVYNVVNNLVATDLIEISYNGVSNAVIANANGEINKTLLYGESVTTVLDDQAELQNYIDNKSYSITVNYDNTLFDLVGDSQNYDWTGYQFNGHLFVVQAHLTFSGLQFNDRMYDATNNGYVDLGHNNKGLQDIDLTTGLITKTITINVEGKATAGLYEDTATNVNATIQINRDADGMLYNATFADRHAGDNKVASWQTGEWTIVTTSTAINPNVLDNYAIGGDSLTAVGNITEYNLSVIEFYIGERLYDKTDKALIKDSTDSNLKTPAEYGYVDSLTNAWVKLNEGDVLPAGEVAGYRLSDMQEFNFRTAVEANHKAIKNLFDIDEAYIVVYADGKYINSDAGEKEAIYANTDWKAYGADAANYNFTSAVVKSWNYINAAPITKVSGFVVNKVVNFEASDANQLLNFITDNSIIDGILAGDQLELDTRKLGSAEYKTRDASGNLVTAFEPNVEFDSVNNVWKLIDGMNAYEVYFTTVGFNEVYDASGNIITKRENYEVGGATIVGAGYIYPEGTTFPVTGPVMP